jgi:hypothetical protein
VFTEESSRRNQKRWGRHVFSIHGNYLWLATTYRKVRVLAFEIVLIWYLDGERAECLIYCASLHDGGMNQSMLAMPSIILSKLADLLELVLVVKDAVNPTKSASLGRNMITNSIKTGGGNGSSATLTRSLGGLVLALRVDGLVLALGVDVLHELGLGLLELGSTGHDG